MYRNPSTMEGSLLSKIVNNTLMAGACGCVVSLLVGAITIRKNYSQILGVTVNGALSGMVSSSSGFVKEILQNCDLGLKILGIKSKKLQIKVQSLSQKSFIVFLFDYIHMNWVYW